MVELRAYQKEALARLREAYVAGKRRVLVSLPTGTGKTVVFAHFPTMLRMQKRLLVLAHREELLLQARDKFFAVDPNLRVEIEQAGSRASGEAKVVVASIPTLARKNSPRLANLRPDDFSIIVVDEAHHAVAPTYRRIFDHFGLFEPDNRRFLIGFTATPRRGDQQGLGEIFEEVCYARDLRDMIREGFLVCISGWRVTTDVSLDGVKVSHGDFVESQLSTVVNTAERNALLVKAYRELATGRRAIVFCVDVAHAHAAGSAFAASGLRAATVWGAQPKDDRRSILKRFSEGDLDVVTNCNLLTEGFDEPRVDCIMMARPTRSKLLYAQMVGRGTRLHPDKKDLLIVDVADNSRMHKLTGLSSLFDFPTDMNLRGADVIKIEDAIREINRTQPWIDTSRIRSPDDLDVVAERIDFFNFDPPAELARFTVNSWFAAGGGFRLSLPEGMWLSVSPNLLGTWEVERHSTTDEGTLIERGKSLEAAIVRADRIVAQKFPDARPLVDRNARWRDQPPTEKQLQFLSGRGISIPDRLTRGHVGQMISMVKSMPAGNRKRSS